MEVLFIPNSKQRSKQWWVQWIAQWSQKGSKGQTQTWASKLIANLVQRPKPKASLLSTTAYPSSSSSKIETIASLSRIPSIPGPSRTKSRYRWLEWTPTFFNMLCVVQRNPLVISAIDNKRTCPRSLTDSWTRSMTNNCPDLSHKGVNLRNSAICYILIIRAVAATLTRLSWSNSGKFSMWKGSFVDNKKWIW